MRNHPRRRAFRVPVPQRPDGVEEAEQFGRHRLQLQGARGIEQEEPRHGLARRLQLQRGFVRHDAVEVVSAAGLATAHFVEVDGRHAINAAGERRTGLHEGAVEGVEADERAEDGDGCVGGRGAGAVGEEEEIRDGGFGVALHEERGRFGG